MGIARKVSKPQKREIRGLHHDKKHQEFKKSTFKGDPDFTDERKLHPKIIKKEKGFLAKLFS
jgi:hypothetical protein